MNIIQPLKKLNLPVCDTWMNLEHIKINQTEKNKYYTESLI